MRRWVRTSLFTSAFSPALLSVAVARWWDTGLSEDVFAYGAAGFLGILAAFLLWNYIKKKGEVLAFTAKKIESSDALMLGVVATYIVPFISRAHDITWKVSLLVGTVIVLVFWLSNQILPHPVLRLMRVRFYKVESSAGVVYVLLSERELLDPRNITKVRQISNSMLMEVP